MAFKPETLMGTNRDLKYAGNRHIYEVLAKFSASNIFLESPTQLQRVLA